MNLDHMQAQVRKATQEWASIFSQFPWQRWWRSAPKVMEMVLVVLLAKAAADVTWLIFSPSEEAAGSALSVAPLPRTPVAEVARLNTVANLHLFGIPSKLTSAQGAEIDARETGLKLTLRGVFASNEPQQSMAIVADQQNNEKVYVRGDAVVAGVVLYEVYPDRVILERSGSYETLTMPRDGKDKPSVITPVGRTPPPVNVAPPPGPSASAGERLKDLRDNLVNQPKKFWDQVRIDPVADPGTGQLRGFRFNHRDPQVLQSMGLRPDDVIVEVNGLPATDPSVLQNLMNMQGNQDLRIGVERQGRREELRISM